MKLMEFFSQNNSVDEKDKMSDEMEKDLMAFILDNNDIYKKHLLPLIKKHKKGEDLDYEDYKDAIKDCCKLFYKEKDFKKDPNELFPLKMRMKIADKLIKINKDSTEKKKKEKDEDSRSVI
jgi:hypothetical protein